MPRAANRSAWARARPGGAELMSITSASAVTLAAAPSGPKSTESTAGPLGQHGDDRAGPFTAAAALSATVTPCSVSESALDLLRFHMISV